MKVWDGGVDVTSDERVGATVEEVLSGGVREAHSKTIGTRNTLCLVLCDVALVAVAGLTLADAKTLVDIISGVITTGAVIVGGTWAYYRFIKDRTYRPRLAVTLAGEWIPVQNERILLARIRVTNIGDSVVTLLQRGTGLRVSQLDEPDEVGQYTWTNDRVHVILAEHAWIEPGETVSDDLLLLVSVPADQPVLLEARLVWRWSGNEGNIVVFARQILTPSESLSGEVKDHE